jgi:DNA-binding transcriptional LysR family regulator
LAAIACSDPYQREYDMLNVKWLRALQAVVVSKSVTEAARRLNVTQSAVSRMIAGLEAEVGFTLFSRQGGRLSITPQGEAFYIEAERALAGLDEMGRIGRNIRSGGGIRLRVFAMSPFVDEVIPSALAAFAKDYPDATVLLDIRGGRDSVTWDMGRRYDVGLIVLPQDERPPHTEPFAKAAAHAAMAPGHRLSRSKSVKLQDLAKERLVLLPGTSLLRRWIDERFAALDRTPTVHLETSSMTSACRFASLGLGVTICDPLTLHALRHARLAARPIRPTLSMSLAFVLRPDQEPSPPVARFMQLVRESCARVMGPD